MGTNFYEKGYCHDTNPEHHVGKRYAAGRFCWDCQVGLPIIGKQRIGGILLPKQATVCPQCKSSGEDEGLEHSSAGRELGFNKEPYQPKSGIASASGFIWAMPPEKLEGIAAIEDEYGQSYTRAEFMEMLQECPIQEFNSLGRWFS